MCCLQKSVRILYNLCKQCTNQCTVRAHVEIWQQRSTMWTETAGADNAVTGDATAAQQCPPRRSPVPRHPCLQLFCLFLFQFPFLLQKPWWPWILPPSKPCLSLFLNSCSPFSPFHLLKHSSIFISFFQPMYVAATSPQPSPPSQSLVHSSALLLCCQGSVWMVAGQQCAEMGGLCAMSPSEIVHSDCCSNVTWG